MQTRRWSELRQSESELCKENDGKAGKSSCALLDQPEALRSADGFDGEEPAYDVVPAAAAAQHPVGYLSRGESHSTPISMVIENET